jgi:hypothetical protein
LSTRNSWLLLLPRTDLLWHTLANKSRSSWESWAPWFRDWSRGVVAWKTGPLRDGDLTCMDLKPWSLCLTKFINRWSHVTSSRMYRSVFCLSAWWSVWRRIRLLFPAVFLPNSILSRRKKASLIRY